MPTPPQEYFSSTLCFINKRITSIPCKSSQYYIWGYKLCCVIFTLKSEGKLKFYCKIYFLQPYLHHHGPTHHHRVVRDCQPSAYGNITYEEVAPHRSSSLKSPQPVVNYKDFVYKVCWIICIWHCFPCGMGLYQHESPNLATSL